LFFLSAKEAEAGKRKNMKKESKAYSYEDQIWEMELREVCYMRSNAFARVHKGSGKPGKSWNFFVVFSRTELSWTKATGPGISGNLFNSSKKYEMYARQ